MAELTPEIYKGTTKFEIPEGVAFKPFRGARRYYQPPRGKEPFNIPEEYDYLLYLRELVSYKGTEGFIDVLSDDGRLGSVILNTISRKFPLETPLGSTHFCSTYNTRTDQHQFEEEPAILRLSFLANSPLDYIRLLNSYVEVQLGKENYLLLWNLSRPVVERTLKSLEQGERLIVVEKNLFNTGKNDKSDQPTGKAEVDTIDIETLEIDTKDDYKKEDDLRMEEFGRITTVWLPPYLKLLRSIQLRFNQFGSDSNYEEPREPVTPEKERIPVLI